jgi:hypothetical protein
MKLHVSDVGANIVSGNAISTSTMKGVMIQNTNNGDESIGVWFNTGGSHWSGITGQRTAAATNWATDLRFFTHEAALIDLTYARERMRIDGEGKVGIGTTSPDTKLHIVSSEASVIKLISSGGDARINIGHSGNGGFIGYSNTGSTGNLFYVTTGAGTIGSGFVMDNNGNVGIGTTAPTNNLEVYSAAGVANHAPLRLTNGTGAAGANVEIFLSAAGNAGGVRLRAEAPGANHNNFSLYVTNAGTLQSTPAIFAQGSSNNVGIGVTSAFGNGVKVIGIANATTVPNADPSGGGVLYVEGGALKYRGSNGTITTIAPA